MGWVFRLNRWVRWLLAIAAAVMLAELIVYRVWLVDFADAHEGLAAWLQAFFVVIAVYMSGVVASKQAKRQEEAQTRSRLRSVTAIIECAVDHLSIIDIRLQQHASLLVAPSPLEKIRAIEVSLTPLRIHELPDPELIVLAIQLKAELGPIGDFQLGNAAYLAEVQAAIRHAQLFLARVQDSRWTTS